MSLLTSPRRERALDFGEGWDESPTGLLVPPRPKRHFGMPVAIDLFAGAGGMSCGLHQAGFHVIAALERWPTAAITYAVNLGRWNLTKWHFETDEIEAEFVKDLDPKGKMQQSLDEGTVTPQMCADFPTVGSGWISNEPDALPVEHMWLWDARTITGADFLDAIDAELGDVDLVAGGPPCQGFSVSGKRNIADPRNNLVFEFARLICEIKPKSMIMENVPGILSMRTEDGRSVMDAFCAILEDGNYAAHEATRAALLARTDLGHARGRPKGQGAQDARRVDRGAEDPDEAEQLALGAMA